METIYVREKPVVTSEDIAWVEKLIEIKNRGGLADGRIVTNLYNKLLQKNERPTSCGSCIRGRVQQLENWYNNYKKQLEVEENNHSEATETPSEGEKTPEVINNIPEEKESIVEAKNEEKVVATQPKSKGRPRKEKK